MRKSSIVNTALSLTAALIAILAVSPTRAAADDNVVYVNSSGGSLDDAYRKVYWDPFTEATGIKVVVSAPIDVAKLKAMVTSGNVEWDITEIVNSDLKRAIKEGLVQKIDFTKLPKSELAKEAYTDYGIWDTPGSTVLTWNTEVFPLTGKHPTSLMDLWNQKDFPGPRCLYKDALDNLELGVMHAGIAREKVYPIDQDLAYKELDKLKKDVAVWWTSGAQSVQAVVDKECVMGTTWAGRPYQLVMKDKAPLGVAWENAILRVSSWAIPKGAKHYDNAMKLLAWMEDAKRQAESIKVTGYGGANMNAVSFLPDDIKQYLSTSPEHLATTLRADDDWWDVNGPEAEKRFTGWVIAN